MRDLRFPIGPFDRETVITPDARRSAIHAVRDLPARMREAVAGLDEARLDTAYRPGGWTVRQLVHHVADSHMNGYIRLKLGLTEEHPTIKPYDQDRWVALPDSRLPIDVSLAILDNVHLRWVTIWATLDEPSLARTFQHPEIGPMTLDRHLQLYAWHSRHHVAHITELRARERW